MKQNDAGTCQQERHKTDTEAFAIGSRYAIIEALATDASIHYGHDRDEQIARMLGPSRWLGWLRSSRSLSGASQ